MPEPNRFDGKNFIAIDDNVAFLEVVELMLMSSSNVSVGKFTSVVKAVEILSEPGIKVDCILCDHGLGPPTGIDLLKEIRSGLHATVDRDMRFLIMTGVPSPDLVAAAQDLDADGFLVKPVRTAVLLDSLDKAFTCKIEVKPASYYSKIQLPAAQFR